MEYEKNWIKEGGQAAHRDNIKQRIWIEKLVFKTKDKESSGSVPDRILLGVVCHWYDNDGKFQRGQFHSHELIPWKIAEGGEEKINEFINLRKVS